MFTLIVKLIPANGNVEAAAEQQRQKMAKIGDKKVLLMDLYQNPIIRPLFSPPSVNMDKKLA